MNLSSTFAYFVVLVIGLTLPVLQKTVDAESRDIESLRVQIDDTLQDTLDGIIQDLEEKYGTFDPGQFWHPYVYGTGNENREILHVRSVEQVEVTGDFIQWKYARLGLKHYLIGLKQRQINVVGLDFQPVDEFTLDHDLDALTVFTKWNEAANQPEMVIITVSSEPKLYLHSFENDVIQPITSFPLHYAVKTIEYCHVGLSSKVVLIPKDSTVDIDIYNVEVHNSTQVWFFQRIAAKDANTNVVVYDSDMLESVIAVSGGSKLYIHTFDSKSGMFAISQDVALPNACSTLFSFTVAYQHYIGCVPLDPELTVRFVSFNYNTNEYVLEDEDSTFQDSRTTSVYPIAVPDYTDQYFILFRNVEGETRIMVYHGRHAGFQMEYNCTNSSCPDVSDLSKGVGFRHRDYSAFIFPSGDQGGNSIVWLITKEILDTRSPLLDESRQLYNNYNELSKRFQKWEQSIAEIEAVLNNSVKPEEPNIITGSWDLEQITSSTLLGDGKKPQLETVNHNLRFVGSDWTQEDFSTDTKQISDELNSLKRNASLAKSELSYAIMADSDTLQHITAPQRVTGKFHTISLLASKIVTESLHDGEIDPDSFLNSLVLKSNDVRVSGQLVFESPVKISTLNASTINEIPVSDIARYSQDNVFECPVQFTGGVHALGNVLSPTINGVSVPEELMLASNISGVNFVDGFVISNNTNSKGDYSFDKVLLKSTSQVVSSQIHFDQLDITSPLNVTNMDDYDVNSFLSSVVTSDYSGLISGRKIVVDSINVISLLNIGSTWNNVSFPNGFIRNNQNRVVINVPTTFNSLTVKKVVLGGTLNGISIDDFVTRNTKQDLPTTWTFTGPVTIIHDIKVNGFADGVDMKELANKATLNDLKDVHIYADVIFERNITFDNLTVMGDINGQNIELILNDFQLFNGTNCHIPGLTTILTNLTLDNITVNNGNINNQPLSKFFLINGDQNITEDVILSQNASFSSLYALSSYDGVNLANLLDNAVRLTGSNKIHWKTTFEHIQCGDDGMIIEGTINEFSDFGTNVAVTSGRPSQKFLSPVEFDMVTFNSTVVQQNFSTTDNQRIKGFDIRSWYSRRLSLSKGEFINVPVFIDGTVTTAHNAYIPIINNISMDTLSRSTFQSDTPDQIFSSHITFLNELEVVDGAINFVNGVGGYDLNDIRDNAFPLNSNQSLELHGIWRFESLVISKELSVDGETCGVYLPDLVTTAVRKDALDIHISDGTNFHDVTVDKLLQMDTLNGKNTDDLFTTNTNQTIQCNFEAKKNIKITGNLITDGTINEVSTDLLTKRYAFAPHNTTHIISSTYKFNHNLTTENLIVRGTIQGKDFSNTAKTQHLIKVGDSGLRFTGTKTFTSSITIAKNSSATSYNDLSIETLQFQMLDEDITLPASSTFHGTVVAKSVEINNEEGGDITAEIVNGFKWDDILTNSIPLSEEVDPVHLENLIFDSVIVDGHLNATFFQGHRFEDFLRLESPPSSSQNMGDIKVRKVKIAGPSVRVGGLVDGVKLEDEFDRTVMVEDADSLQLSGNREFSGTLTVEGDVDCFPSNFQDSVIDITQPFTIPNSVEFTSPIVIENGLNVSQLVQNTTIDEIMTDALTNGKNGEEQVVSGTWEFTNELTLDDDVRGPGELKNFDLQSLITETEYEVRAAKDKIESQKLTFREECKRVYDVTQDLLYNPMKLDAFDKHQTIPLLQQADKMVIVKSSGKFVLLTSTGCTLTKFEWKNNTELFYQESTTTSEYDKLNFGQVKQWQSTLHDKDGLLLFSTESSPCSALSKGLHFTVMTDSATFSPVHTLLLGDIPTFSLISDTANKHTAVFAMKNDTLQIFTWNSHNNKFLRIEWKLDTIYDGLETTLHTGGVALLLTSPYETAILQFNWNRQEIQLLAQEQFITSGRRGGSAIFDSYGSLHALILGKSSPSQSQFSGVQLFSVVDGHLVKLQQLPLTDSNLMSVIHFSHQTFLSLLSKTYGLNIFKFQGLNGLQRLNSNPIKIFDGVDMVTFDVKAWDFSAPRPFIAILTSTTVEIFHSNVYGDSLDYTSQGMCKVK